MEHQRPEQVTGQFEVKPGPSREKVQPVPETLEEHGDATSREKLKKKWEEGKAVAKEYTGGKYRKYFPRMSGRYDYSKRR